VVALGAAPENVNLLNGLSGRTDGSEERQNGPDHRHKKAASQNQKADSHRTPPSAKLPEIRNGSSKPHLSPWGILASPIPWAIATERPSI